MSNKKKKDGFNNRAARRFNDPQKVDRMSEEEVYEILSEDIKTILGQVTAHRNHDRGAKYPTYVNNIFANLSSAKFFYEYACNHTKRKKKNRVKTDLDMDQVLSMKQILADAYRYATSNKDAYRNQMQEYSDRIEYLSMAFIRFDPVVYRLSKKLNLKSKDDRRDLCIQVYQDPIYSAKAVARLFNSSEITEKKKFKLVRTLYKVDRLDNIKVYSSDDDRERDDKSKNRFVALVGATFCIQKNNSDFFDMLFEYVDGLKKKKRAKYIRAYAEAYKNDKTHNKRLEGDFYEKNHDIIKELVGTKKHKYTDGIDVGYKKAFKCLKKNTESDDKKVKDSDRLIRDGYKKPW